VATYLTSQGVSGQYLSVIGKGPADPIASNATPDGRAQNRRVQITLMPIPGMNYQQQGVSSTVPNVAGGATTLGATPAPTKKSPAIIADRGLLLSVWPGDYFFRP
jgi:hypothetical protein